MIKFLIASMTLLGLIFLAAWSWDPDESFRWG